MPRPKTKAVLLSLSEANFQRLFDLIESLSPETQEQEFPPGTMNRNIRDVLMHLHHWHLMMNQWHQIGMTGAKPDMPAKGYTWKTAPDLNREIWKMYSDTPLNEAKAELRSSYTLARNIIESHTDEELFEKKRYRWTGSTSMGSYLVSATSSHYDWAYKLIKKAKK